MTTPGIFLREVLVSTEQAKSPFPFFLLRFFTVMMLSGSNPMEVRMGFS
jgi:hypothetical protein